MGTERLVEEKARNGSTNARYSRWISEISGVFALNWRALMNLGDKGKRLFRVGRGGRESTTSNN